MIDYNYLTLYLNKQGRKKKLLETILKNKYLIVIKFIHFKKERNKFLDGTEICTCSYTQ